MGFVFRCLMALIRFAIFVGMAGGLVDLTRSMGKEVIKAHRHGIVSLRELNRQLVGQ